MIAKDVFVALAVVVAKALYILESDSSILDLLQAPMIKWGKVSEFVGPIVYTTKHCIGFTLDFGFKIYNRIHALCLLKNDKTNPVTKLSGLLSNPKNCVALLYDNPNTRH